MLFWGLNLLIVLMIYAIIRIVEEGKKAEYFADHIEEWDLDEDEGIKERNKNNEL